MGFMSINDLFLECTRALVLVILLAILFLRGSFTSLGKHPGWKHILTGFCLITAATLLDITDEIPGLEKYVIIGDTIYEAFLEKLPGYLLGFVLVLIGFFKMIPSLQRAEQHEKALFESEDRFRQIFEANPDPVILAQLESGEIIDVNPAFIEQSGYERKSVLGKNSAELELWGRPEQRDEFRQALQQQGVVENIESDFCLKNGSRCPGLLSARVVTISGIPCVLIVVRDISKIKEAEKALHEVDRSRSEFISMAAHELRTPLSVLIGYSELLLTPESQGKITDAKRDEFLGEIMKKGIVLSQIVDDLLDISRIDAGRALGLNYASIKPGQLLQQTFKHFQVHSPQHKFCLDLDPSEETRIDCDEQRVLQVLENLLSNAAKYTPEGGHITLAGRDHFDRYEFAIRDNGIGMTEDQISKACDKFYRADTSNTAIGGLGLGMSIVKKIVDAHNGSISIDSTPGEGTCVSVSLPKARS